MAVISTYSKSADLTTEPPVTSVDDNILKSLYERERLGWLAQCTLTGHLTWTLIPDFMADLAGCMLQSAYMLGEPRDHAYSRSAPVAVAARAAHRPRARPFAGLTGMGSPVSMKRRRVWHRLRHSSKSSLIITGGRTVPNSASDLQLDVGGAEDSD